MPEKSFDLQLFLERVRDASSRDLTKKTRFYQKTSSMEPLLRYLIRDPECEMLELKPLLAKIPIEKQQKYADALKYLKKSKEGLPSKMFHSLQTYAKKLSKDQQRFIIPMLEADSEVGPDKVKYAQAGLCQNLTLFWLREQFQPEPTGNSAFPRGADQNVMASAAAYEVTKKAAGLTKNAGSAATSLGMAPTPVRHGLEWLPLSDQLNYQHSGIYAQFNLLNATTNQKEVAGAHAIGVFRDPSKSILFYDSNAGSYRVEPQDFCAFIKNYVEECLPKKWPTLRPDKSLSWFYVNKPTS